ncbi:MAG: 7-cyano-7-deazaguanine synthase, partial [Candidatus Shapirobacteria bacterium]
MNDFDQAYLECFANWQLNNSSLGCDFEVVVTDVGKAGYKVYLGEGFEQEQANPDLVLMYGAGIDSTIAIWYALALGYKRIALFQVNYGAPYAGKEAQVTERLKEMLPSSVRIKRALPVFKGVPAFNITEAKMGKGYIIPVRNAVLASIGAGIGNNVWIVANYRKIDDEPGAAVDKNRRFFADISYLLSRMLPEPITVSSPFLHLTKRQTIEWFIEELGRERALEILKLTTTCYHPSEH